MGALAFELRPQPPRPAQPRLFAVAGGAVAEPAAAPAALTPAPAPDASAVPATPTLDALVTRAFSDVAAGRRSTCVVCGGAVRSRPATVGTRGSGRCDGCGSDYEL